MDIFFQYFTYNRYMLETLYCSNWDKEVCLGLCCHRSIFIYFLNNPFSFILFLDQNKCISGDRNSNYIHFETWNKRNLIWSSVCVCFNLKLWQWAIFLDCSLYWVISVIKPPKAWHFKIIMLCVCYPQCYEVVKWAILAVSFAISHIAAVIWWLNWGWKPKAASFMWGT